MARYRVLAIVSLAVALTAGVTWTFAQPRTTALRAQEYIDIQQLDAAYNHALDTSDADKLTSFTGVYADKLAKTPNGWRLKARTFANDAQP